VGVPIPKIAAPVVAEEQRFCVDDDIGGSAGKIGLPQISTFGAIRCQSTYLSHAVVIVLSSLAARFEGTIEDSFVNS
jgi:hypothetical protein